MLCLQADIEHGFGNPGNCLAFRCGIDRVFCNLSLCPGVIAPGLKPVSNLLRYLKFHAVRTCLTCVHACFGLGILINFVVDQIVNIVLVPCEGEPGLFVKQVLIHRCLVSPDRFRVEIRVALVFPSPRRPGSIKLIETRGAKGMADRGLKSSVGKGFPDSRDLGAEL